MLLRSSQFLEQNTFPAELNVKFHQLLKIIQSNTQYINSYRDSKAWVDITMFQRKYNIQIWLQMFSDKDEVTG